MIMYDSVTLAAIPRDAKAVAGYVDGRWPTYPRLAQAFPHARRLSIATSADHDADCLDVERFDAAPEQAPAWVARQGGRPVLYCSVSQAAALLALVPRAKVRLWTAHYTGVAHRCGPECGFGLRTRADATQYASSSAPPLDTSLCAWNFFLPRLPRLPGWLRWGHI